MYDYLKGAWSPEEGLGRDDEAGSDNDMSRENADPSESDDLGDGRGER